MCRLAHHVNNLINEEAIISIKDISILIISIDAEHILVALWNLVLEFSPLHLGWNCQRQEAQ